MFHGVWTPPKALDEIQTRVEKYFTVETASTTMKGRVPVYIYQVHNQKHTKKPFKRLLSDVTEEDYRVLLRQEEDTRFLKIIAVPTKEALQTSKTRGEPREKPAKQEEIKDISQDVEQVALEKENGEKQFPYWTLISLLITIGVMTFSGYQFSIAFRQRAGIGNLLSNTILYIISLLSIISIHEFGHMFASKLHNIEATYPIFIPGYPFGTFGAFIKQKSPPANRDELFDLGIMGPLFGFFIAIPVSIGGILLSHPIPEAAIVGDESIFRIPRLLLYYFLTKLKPSLTAEMDLLLHPVALAGWLGFLLTGLNLLPVSQLDGGHIAQAMFNEKIHRYLSYILIGFLFITGFFLMALLLLMFLRGGPHPPPLDNVSDLSRKRKIIGILSWGVILLTFPIDPILNLSLGWGL